MTTPRNFKEIAQRLGVSPSTVSKTLNGNGRVNVATRKRILVGVEEVGYTPNLNGQRLVTGRSYNETLGTGFLQN